MNWHIGCSGFHYREWKEIFYPPGLAQRRWFEYYSERFDALELNVTFYRFPRVSFLRTWYDKSPGHFHFAVKAPRLITHFFKFTNVKRYMDDFYGTISTGLGEKLGPVLFQLPPGMEYSKEKMQLIIENLNPSFMNVVECRHTSWWTKQVYTAFKKHHISFCGISHPTLPDDVIATAPTLYYRFHGVPRLYYSKYPATKLKETVDAIRQTSAKEVYIFFNNTAGAGAIRNAETIRKQIRRASVVKKS